ncbi:hypothetical protein EON65_39015 [archaeon]|nr:MAG: hypothetical protein EON65_39015 [archaeon]
MLGQTILAIKEHVADGGLYGVTYANVLADLNVSHAVGLYIAKTYLYPAQYRFSGEIDIIQLTQIPADLLCISPKHVLTDFYGLEGTEAVHIAGGDEFNALQTVALTRNTGITASEIIHELGNRAVVFHFDKLNIHDIIVKRMLMPKPDAGKNARSQAAVTIYHLKRYARSFQPDIYGSQLSATDNMRDQVFAYFASILDAHNISHLACTDLGRLLKLPKRVAQYIRTLAAVQNDASCPVRFVEKETYLMSLRPGSINLCGYKRYMWCMERVPPPTPTIHSGFYRMSNLPIFDQLARQLQAFQQVGSSEVRKLLSVGRKRSTKIVSLFITRYSGDMCVWLI